MASLIMSAFLVLLGQSSMPSVEQRSLRVADTGTVLLYGVSVPAGKDVREPLPLVLVLHPTNTRGTYYYGASLMRQIFSPALNNLDAIMIAPDCPARDWTDPKAERALIALVENVITEYGVDRRRVLIAGFSMGAQGVWFMESRHTDMFTAAIVIAGSARNEPTENLGKIPTYVIHSRDDQVVPFQSAQQTVQELQKIGREVKLDALEGPRHYDMTQYVEAIRRAGQWVGEHWSK
jgi:predicted peptidase